MKYYRTGMVKERYHMRNLRKRLISSIIGPYKNCMVRDFPGGPVVKNSPSNAGGVSSIPGTGLHMPDGQKTKILKKRRSNIVTVKTLKIQ